MRRLATVRWTSPAPTSVDEQLAIFDDGSAWLVVRGPRTSTPAIGTYRYVPAEADRGALADAGPDPVVFNLSDSSPMSAGRASLLELADRVAAAARTAPEAVATFFVQELESTGPGSLAVSLLVVASGIRAVEFELDPDGSSILLDLGGQAIGWSELPGLSAGFATSDAVELGGVRRRASIKPGEYGAIAIDLPARAGATGLTARLVGWLSSALPDEPQPARFELLTDEAPLAS